VNGKVRTRIEVEKDTADDKVISLVKAEDKVKRYLEGKKIVKEIIVKNKLVNIVVN
jgi:leucyl-tRNA synthetase